MDPWVNLTTFGNILDSYSDYVVKKYGKATIVFNGYCRSSTKDMTHGRKAKGRKGPTVSFTKEMCLTAAKDVFLSDPQNKQNFLRLLGDNLQMTGCDVFHATSDADVLFKRQLSQLIIKIPLWLEMTQTYWFFFCIIQN